eukprot:1709419-Karenia_brevis.AAC.1
MSEMRAIHSSVMKLYKSFLCHSYKYDDDDVALVLDFKLIAPLAIVAISRIALFKRLVCAGQLNILAVACASRIRARSWMQA